MFVIPHNEIIRHIGGKTNHRIETKLQELTDITTEVIEPHVDYTHLPTEELKPINSKKINKTLDCCDQAVLFVATLGNRFDDFIHDLTEDNHYMDAYLVDAVGSAGAEALVSGFHEEMEDYFQQQDRGVTLRFSPGYCDWSIQDQVYIFDLVNTDVRLNNSYIMSPTKSVSGLFGITTDFCESIENNPCEQCRNIRCQVRRG